jgi:hypothetical protein
MGEAIGVSHPCRSLILLTKATKATIIVMNSKATIFTRILMSVGIICVIFPINAQDIRFPADAGIINIKEAPYNAKGDGVHDDTQAILAALRDWNYNVRFGQSATIYFPQGTYLVSNTLESIDKNGVKQCGIRLIGENKDNTIIKLIDNTPGFNSTGPGKPVIRTNGLDGNRGNWGYSNYIQNLTIDIGRGNIGAIGIHYLIANWGTISKVNIKSSDPAKSGKYGILIDDLSGAGLVEQTSVDGFDYGIFTQTVVNNIVFDKIKISNQKIAGIRNMDKNLAIYGLESNNKVPAIQQASSEAYLALVDSKLLGGLDTKAAIENGSAFLFARNVITDGYGLAIDNIQGTGASDVSGGSNVKIEEWLSHPPVVKAWENSPAKSLNLPVKDAPEYHTNDFTEWANIKKYGATANDDIDDTEAIQKAIDSGAKIIYFPWGTYTINGVINVRANVRKIDFIWSKIKGSGQIVLGETEGSSIILENVYNAGVDLIHASSKDVVYRYAHNSANISNTNVASGDLFITDIGPWGTIKLTNGISAWIRQLNREQILFENNGCKVWLFGMNVELKSDDGVTRAVNPFRTVNGGVTEIIGGAVDPLNIPVPESKGAIFIVENSSISVTIAGNVRPGGFLELWLTEKRNDELRKVYNTQFITQGQRFVIPLFSGKEITTNVDKEITIKDQKFDIFPIPVSNRLNIDTQYATEYNIQLLDSVGGIVLQKNNIIGNCSFNVNKLISGVYILKMNINNGEEIFCKKIVKV